MTQEEKRIEEIEKEIETLKKERTALKEKISSENSDANFARMLSRVEMKVAFGNVLFIYCSDDEGLEHYDSYQNHTDGIYKFMSELIDKIVKKLGNPKYYDLKDAKDSRYCHVPHFRVLIFNTPDGWNDTLEDVINKIKIEKMTTEEIRKYLWEKWCNYSRGLAMSFAFREDKSYTFKDVKEAFESGFYEFQQICYKNNIKMEDLKLE